MIHDKHRLQLYTSLVLSALILCLGLLSASSAIGLLRSALEKQMAEDGEIIGENLRIIIDQLTREYAERSSALPHIQKVLETLHNRGWVGFACVLDRSGRVLAHPRSEYLDMQVPIETYEPTGLRGAKAPPMGSLPLLDGTDTVGIYRTARDIIAVRWLPGLKTYLCVHQSLRALDRRIDRLRRILALIGIGFIAIASVGAWFFVGKLVDRYESHLSRSEARNRVLVQNSTPILVLDTSGAVLDANPQAVALFQASRTDLLEMDLKALWLPDRQDRLEGLFREVISSDIVERHDLDMRTAEGRTVPVDLRACRVEYGDREAVYLLIRDVTESRRAREEILEANRRLRELDRLKSDFLNTVSHELRTPLTSIKWSSESLAALAGGRDDETVQKLLGIIRDDNQRLSALIEQLLGFSRIDAGKLQLLFQTVDLSHLLQRALRDVERHARQKDIALIPPDLSAALRLKADPEQLHHVFVNILENAVKYTPPGGSVCLSGRVSAGWVEVAVKDTGIGIPEGAHSSIFDKFYRTDQAAVRRERGTGLGLSIVKGIVDAHGGEVRVQSAVGAGATFTVRLPQDGPPESEAG